VTTTPLLPKRGPSVLLVSAVVLVGPLVPTSPAVLAAEPAVAAARALPLGAAGLTETRSTATLQPGVTLTTVVRGAVDPRHVWTVEVNIPVGATSPDPDAPAAALSDRAGSDALAARLRAAGFEQRVEEVTTPATADYRGGRLGWRVRRLTIDPRTFSGTLQASYGPDLEARETVSALSRATGATAAVNAGYFVLDPAAGAPGDPAGVGVYDGRLLSETVGRRPALVLRDDARRTRVARLRWSGSVTAAGTSPLTLDGIDRVPGLVRNCGGLGDSPTTAPLHDFTGTDADELVAFAPQYSSATPAGAGLEAVLDRQSRVVSLRSPRGGPLLAGYRSVQATGARVAELEQVATVGARLRIRTSLRAGGQVLARTDGLSVVNGGPVLVRDGRLHVTPQRDGFVRPTNPSSYYGFSAERNPRTFAGVDARGRTLLATVDGRSTKSLGLSIVETARVAKALA